MFFHHPKGANSTKSQKAPFDECMTRVCISKAEKSLFSKRLRQFAVCSG